MYVCVSGPGLKKDNKRFIIIIAILGDQKKAKFVNASL